ncbi:hypothetical protein [Rhodococcus sp. A5(2022)]|uniref:hypothetical protein n=1 Tax=Rhodococcus sp. A5(2022) TaxID=3003588 RepID=UPI0022A83C6F|nr:hypothetical protein [Rhodococcus sp. A5(2022)]MCZ1070816.1 hypothetical protein [Rhodococcus sp. A5(2022)]
MALATVEDVEARLGRSLTTAETSRVHGLLDEASALVEGEGYVFPDPQPAAVAIVVSRMVARALRAPEGAEGLESTQVSAGSFQMTRNFTDSSGGVWLSKSDLQILRRFKPSGGVSMGLVSERSP